MMNASAEYRLLDVMEPRWFTSHNTKMKIYGKKTQVSYIGGMLT